MSFSKYIKGETMFCRDYMFSKTTTLDFFKEVEQWQF